MLFLSWIVLGLIVAFAGTRFVNQAGKGLTLDVAAGVGVAIVGGLLFNAVRGSRAGVLIPWSLSAAVICSTDVLRACKAWSEMHRTPLKMSPRKRSAGCFIRDWQEQGERSC